mmetsp:Transcript_22657/g.45547  ORF Transcript_22657/g.45547 Transcript_22657/m.45547 type:complete len:289 (+) Transcript_22657:84-950(+)
MEKTISSTTCSPARCLNPVNFIRLYAQMMRDKAGTPTEYMTKQPRLQGLDRPSLLCFHFMVSTAGACTGLASLRHLLVNVFATRCFYCSPRMLSLVIDGHGRLRRKRVVSKGPHGNHDMLFEAIRLPVNSRATFPAEMEQNTPPAVPNACVGFALALDHLDTRFWVTGLGSKYVASAFLACVAVTHPHTYGFPHTLDFQLPTTTRGDSCNTRGSPARVTFCFCRAFRFRFDFFDFGSRFVFRFVFRFGGRCFGFDLTDLCFPRLFLSSPGKRFRPLPHLDDFEFLFRD